VVTVAYRSKNPWVIEHCLHRVVELLPSISTDRACSNLLGLVLPLAITEYIGCHEILSALL